MLRSRISREESTYIPSSVRVPSSEDSHNANSYIIVVCTIYSSKIVVVRIEWVCDHLQKNACTGIIVRNWPW